MGETKPIPTGGCSDWQFYATDPQTSVAITWTGVRSVFLDPIAPVVRPSPVTTNVWQKFEHFYDRYEAIIPEGCEGFNHGVSFGGDMLDTSTDPEWDSIMAPNLERIGRTKPGMRVSGLAGGNHDDVLYGVTNTGEVAAGVFGIALKVNGPQRTMRHNIGAYEAGGPDKLMTKEKRLERTWKLLGIPWEPVRLAHSDWKSYRLAEDRRSFSWERHLEAGHRLARSYNGGKVWSVLVDFDDGKNRVSEQKWIGVHAVMTHEARFSGDTPVFEIYIDMTDYTEDTTANGALLGHFSFTQTRLLQGLKAAIQERFPNALFGLKTHNPIDDIDRSIVQVVTGSRDPRMKEFLSDPDVIYVVAGHTHNWGYKELTFPGRKTPLYMLAAPSLVDEPVGAMAQEVATRPGSTRFVFHPMEFDPRQVSLGDDLDVVKELQFYSPGLMNSALHAWRHLSDPRHKYASMREASLMERIPYIFEFHAGELFDDERFYDQLTGNDTVRYVASYAHLKLHLTMSYLKMSLYDVDIRDKAAPLEKAYRDLLETYHELFDLALQESVLVKIYKRFAEDERNPRRRAVGQALEKIATKTAELTALMDKRTKEVMATIRPLSDAIRSQKIALKDEPGFRGDPAHYDLLLRSLDNLVFVAADSRSWLLRYQRALHADRSEDEIATMTDLMATPHWLALDKDLQKIAYGGRLTAFRLLISHYGVITFADHTGRNPKMILDGPMEIAVDTRTREVRIRNPPRERTAEERARLREGFSPARRTPREVERTRKAADEVFPKSRIHPTVRAGLMVSQGPSAQFRATAGGQLHVWNPNFKIVSFALEGDLDVRSGGPHGPEVGLALVPMVSALNILQLGLGGTYANAPEQGIHRGGLEVRIGVLDGALQLTGGHDWYSTGNERWTIGLSTDFCADFDLFKFPLRCYRRH